MGTSVQPIQKACLFVRWSYFRREWPKCEGLFSSGINTKLTSSCSDNLLIHQRIAQKSFSSPQQVLHLSSGSMFWYLIKPWRFLHAANWWHWSQRSVESYLELCISILLSQIRFLLVQIVLLLQGSLHSESRSMSCVSGVSLQVIGFLNHSNSSINGQQMSV